MTNGTPGQSDFLIDIALSMEGLTSDQKAVVEAAIPAAQEVIAALQANQAVLAEAADLYAKAQPLIAVFVKAWTTGGIGAAAKVMADVIAAKQQSAPDGAAKWKAASTTST
jgi:hypothetical protein